MTMLVEVGAIAGLSSVMVVMMMAQPRIFYSMAKDGLLPPFAKKIHPKFRTPHITSIITGVAGRARRGVHADRRARRAGQHRDAARVRDRVDRHVFLRYQRPGSRAAVQDAVGAVRADPVGTGQSGAHGRLAVGHWLRLIIWMAIGLVFYFAYGYRHSELRKRQAAR